jgi:pimeloyl-ACP methyl ester carboxylesterase
MRRHGRQEWLETVRAEHPRFTAPLLLIHGLWCTAAVWRAFMGHLAHRGWACHAVTLGARTAGERAVETLTLADYREDLQCAVQRCEAPPILVGHDLGGLLALGCAAPQVCGRVALAPLVPAAIGEAAAPATGSLRARWAAWRAAPLPPPRGRTRIDYFGRMPVRLRVESGRAVHDLNVRPFDGLVTSTVPTLLLAGDRDRISPAASVRLLAERVGGSLQIVPDAGHAQPWDRGWEARVALVHRWLVRTLGEPLLALLEESDGEPDG